MARLLTSLLLVWAVLLGPALCVGGLLEHSCDCIGESEIECQHEDSCLDDPCAGIVRTDDHDDQTNLDFEIPSVPVAVVALETEPPSASSSWSSRPPLPPNRWNLPYAQSDRPQLI